jgi:hypothetical protein
MAAGDAASLKTVTSITSVSAAPSQGGARLTGEFVRPQFTPPAEERENPMDSPGAKLKGDV